jgi:uncharacterized protein (TIGR03435 family)
MVLAVASLLVCVSGAVYGQSAVAQRFEVASIKPSNADPNSTSGIQTGHGRLDANNVTLKRCMMGAFGVGPHQISGGPGWLESDRFEISAKSDQPINDDAGLMVMLQSLLAERFKLVFHRETRTISAFVLEVAKKGPKLQKAEAGEASTNTSTSNTGVMIDAHSTDMDSFAKILARNTELPVVNHTGLAGIFNFKLYWAPENARPKDGAAMEGASIFSAIQEQLGLRLRSQKAPVEFLVIDHVEKPSEN